MKLADYKAAIAPKATDILYTQDEQLVISLILRMDSYKISHPFLYPEGIKGMTSYGEARVSHKQIIIPFGMQLLCKRYLTQRITLNDIDNAEAFAFKHLGRKLFARAAWEKVVAEYNGYLPLTIRAVPEGTQMRGGQPLYTVTVIDDLLFWMSAAFETMIQRGVWYPTTIATQDFEVKQELKRYYTQTGADMNLLPFALHDFGGRGVTCAEQAEIGGAAHTVNFMGSDTIEGILAANFYYKEDMAAYSVVASEHAVECSFGNGRENAIKYLRKMLSLAEPGTIVSIVIDGYDVYREAELLCTEFRDEIIASKAKVVFRPDSGDMLEVVPRILTLQEAAFGYTMTKDGYKKINHVGVLQGDGVDRLAINTLLGKLIYSYGYAADVVLFGSGGALLQKCNRDTLKFAQKACAELVEVSPGSEDLYWKGIAKDPITDSGKKSKEGVLTLVRGKMTGELLVARLDKGPISDDFEDIMQVVYHQGKLYNETTLAEVRYRVSI